MGRGIRDSEQRSSNRCQGTGGTSILPDGVPVVLVSDCGKEVDGQLMNVDNVRTTAYKASTNEAVERFQRTLNSLIGRTIDDHQRDWDSLLPYIMAAYRSSVHESTRYSPNYLTLGRETRAPIDLVYGTPPEPVPTNFDDFAEEMETRMKQAYTLAREQLRVAAQRNKKVYDLRVRPARYKVGDWVLYLNPRKYSGKKDKWRRKYTGPHLVVDVPGPVNVAVQSSPKGKVFLTHIDKAKMFTGSQTPKPWIPDSTPTRPALQHCVSCTAFVTSSRRPSFSRLLLL